MTQRRGWLDNERGSALGIILVMGFVMGVLGYAMLVLAGSQAGQSQGMQERAKAQYLTEAGYVLVMSKLLTYPNYPQTPGSCFISTAPTTTTHCTLGHDPLVPDLTKACNPVAGNAAESVEYIDANGNGIVGPPGDLTDPYVEVTVQTCGQPAGPPFSRTHAIRIKASY